MKKISSIFIACICVIFAITGCGKESHEGEAKTPSGSSIQSGKDYKDVIKDFEEQGFTNVKTEKIEDLITGWLTEDGEVEEVSVGGNVDYSPDEWMPVDTEILIKYHTFEEENETPEEKETESVSEPEVEKEVAPESDEESSSDTEEVEEEILTLENNKEFETILNTKDEFSPLYKEFAEKYAGRTIEFDGYTANVLPYKDYSTRFNYLIYVGDNNATTFSGPQFQFRNVDYSGLHLTGDNIPDTFGVGLNIHITAKVVEFEEDSGLFLLEPVSIEMR